LEDVQLSYSQQGQDLILLDLFRNYSKGIYVDIGCNDPIKLSNTYLFYKMGWSGIAIDAEYHFENKWIKYRKRDRFIDAAISKIGGKINFYRFFDDTTSTTDETTMRRNKENFGEVVEQLTVDSIPAEKILIENDIPENFELLCIDVEGKDHEVLESINLRKYRPKVILIEIKLFNFLQPKQSSIVNFLYQQNYTMVVKTPLDGFFVDKSQDLGWIPDQMLKG